MDYIINGLVVPHISFVGEIEEIVLQEGTISGFKFVVYCSNFIHNIESENNEKINRMRNEIISLINYYNASKEIR
jgi:hypothetical protein